MPQNDVNTYYIRKPNKPVGKVKFISYVKPLSISCFGCDSLKQRWLGCSAQAAGLRQLLKGAFNSGGSSSSGSSSSSRGEGARLFEALHRCWAHSAGALLSLCLLCRAYDHAADVVACFAELPVTLEVLVQVGSPPLLLCCTFSRFHDIVAFDLLPMIHGFCIRGPWQIFVLPHP